ncbi:hypothetical protein JW865_05675 [Candidatus Bathyarchaeota archaeon]|nr:hypothetical protein [Candidatus Bathyarchaeota archaeon]
MKNNDCPVCGGDNANIICPKCGCKVCLDCYDEDAQMCLDCLEQQVEEKRHQKRIILATGILFILLGLSLMASSIVAGLPVETVTIIFPFIIGNVNTGIASLYSFIFFSIVILASLLPWYIHTHLKPNHNVEESTMTIQEGKTQSGESIASVEYIITTELPEKIKRTLFIETEETKILLQSNIDKNFNKTYEIPKGFILDAIDYDYEDNFLVLKLHLIKES